ncbi:hypothetical protein SEUCBS139899_008924 [Sporothrix eucalyptigena]
MAGGASKNGSSDAMLLTASSRHQAGVSLQLDKEGLNLRTWTVDVAFRSPLSWTASSGSWETVQFLLNRKANLNARDCQGQSLLCMAAAIDDKSTGYLNFLQLLLDTFCVLDSIEVSNIYGQTPLAQAVERGNKAIV